MSKPIRISKTTKTTIEIEKSHDYFDKKLVEKSLGYLLYAPVDDNEDKPMTIEVKQEEKIMKKTKVQSKNFLIFLF